MRVAPLAAAMTFLLVACVQSAAEDGTVAEHGSGFDFYVLSLSWSPSYCDAKGARANRLQCGPERDFTFIVHGLWPQYERGYPEFCASDEPQRVPDALVASVLDIMPSPALVGHQWRKHGTCSGLRQKDYLRAAREAFDRVVIPAPFSNARSPEAADPNEIESTFIAVNPGLTPDGIAVTCASGRLEEVRICMTKEFAFRPCPEVNERACGTATVVIPAAP